MDDPLTECERWELLAYSEAQAAGDQTSLAPRAAVTPGPDFWLFDAGTPAARAIVMKYDAEGHFEGGQLITDPGEPDELDAQRREAEAVAVPLNVFLTTVTP